MNNPQFKLVEFDEFKNDSGKNSFYLLGNSTIKEVEQKAGRGIRIPVMGRVVTGIPIEAIQEALDWEEITPELAATGELFALQVRGDSMEPTLRNGDVVIVKKQPTVDTTYLLRFFR